MIILYILIFIWLLIAAVIGYFAASFVGFNPPGLWEKMKLVLLCLSWPVILVYTVFKIK